jgi:hypothetical protein
MLLLDPLRDNFSHSISEVKNLIFSQICSIKTGVHECKIKKNSCKKSIENTKKYKNKYKKIKQKLNKNLTKDDF